MGPTTGIFSGMNDLARRIDAALPQTQCTRCGFPDCASYAQAIASQQAGINQCPPGGAEGIARLAVITGYIAGRGALIASGVRPVPIPSDADGLDVAEGAVVREAPGKRYRLADGWARSGLLRDGDFTGLDAPPPFGWRYFPDGGVIAETGESLIPGQGSSLYISYPGDQQDHRQPQLQAGDGGAGVAHAVGQTVAHGQHRARAR